jgi:hypothetical protein
MLVNALIGVWTGTVKNTNGFELTVTVSINEPCTIGSLCGTFMIPEIPCSGSFRVIRMVEEMLELQAENKQGACGDAMSDSLELLSDDSLLYVSKGKGWEARGLLQRV